MNKYKAKLMSASCMPCLLFCGKDVAIGARRGGQPGAVAPPWNLKMMTSYAVPVENTLEFVLAPSALASNTFKLSLKRRKIAKISVRAFGAPKNRSFLSVHAGLPPSGKIPAGAHGFGAMPRFQIKFCSEHPRITNRRSAN